MSKVIVFGGAGFIGSALIPELLKRHHEVTVVDLFWFGDHLPEGITRINRNAIELTTQDLKGFDSAIFLAGMSNDPMASFDPAGNFVANAAVPSYLAFIAKEAGIKVFIHGGSCSVYGLLEPDCKAMEDIPPRAQTPYGVSKLMAEFGVLRQNGNQMRVVNFRMGTVCGWSPRMRFDLVINTMVKDAFLKGEIHVNDINAERPILDIRDAVSAYAQALTNEDLRGIYNLFSHNTSIGKLAKRVEDRVRIVASRNPTVHIHGGHDNRSYTAANNRAMLAGIYCLTNLDYTIDSVINNMYRYEGKLEDSIYYNIQTFKALPESSLSLVA